MPNGNPLPESSLDQDEIPVRYQKADGYRTLAATGSRGGIQPPGNFKMDFTLDYTADPEKEIHEVTNSGLGEILERQGELEIVREKQVGISMSQRNALSLGAWILASLLGPDIEEEEILQLLHEKYPDRLSREEP